LYINRRAKYCFLKFYVLAADVNVLNKEQEKATKDCPLVREISCQPVDVKPSPQKP